MAEVLGALDLESAGWVEAGFGRWFTGRVAGGFDLRFTGRVAGVFRAGFYVTGDDSAIFAVLGPGAWPGPLHLVAASLPVRPAAGERVTVDGTTLTAGRLEIDFGGARLWDPALPDGLSFDPAVWVGDAAAAELDLADIWAGVVPPVEPDLAGVWDEAAAAVTAGDLASACRLLEGRGGGLTPTGDDALAGIMLAAAADRSRRPALRRLAGQARTSELSRAFLEWAARGSSIEPAHAVLEAAASGDRARLARAARTLSEVGASSGRALLTGMALAVSRLPVSGSVRQRGVSQWGSHFPAGMAPAASRLPTVTTVPPVGAPFV